MNRPQITAINYYDIFPLNNGGKLAIYGLYLALSKWFDVNLVMLDKNLIHKEKIDINKYFKIFPIEKSPQNKRMEYYEHMLAIGKTPEYIEPLMKISRESSVLITEHVYAWRLIKSISSGKKLWYRAQNVEYDYYRSVWKKYNLPKNLFNELFELERECCMSCDAVFTISDSDKKRFQELYGLPEEKIINISAGYETDSKNFTLPSERQKQKKDKKYKVVYISSVAQPAVNAANEIVSIAPDLPNINFVIAGGIGTVINLDNLPKNVNIVGQISDCEKDILFRTSDFALNPIVGGSGLNIKMLEYFAYGLPVITTEFGARGIDIINGTNCILTSIDNLKASIAKFCTLEIAIKDNIAINANNLLREKYSWRNCALKVIECARLSGLLIDDSEEGEGSNIEIIQPSYVSQQYLPVKPFYIRGAGIMGTKCLLWLKHTGLCPIAFLDEDLRKHGTFVNGVEVIPSENCLANDYEIILALENWIDAAKHLLAIGVNINRILVNIYGYVFKLADIVGSESCYIDTKKLKSLLQVL